MFEFEEGQQIKLNISRAFIKYGACAWCLIMYCTFLIIFICTQTILTSTGAVMEIVLSFGFYILFHKFHRGSVNPKAHNNNNNILYNCYCKLVLFVSSLLLLLCMGIINASVSLTIRRLPCFFYTHNTSYKLLKPRRWNDDRL